MHNLLCVVFNNNMKRVERRVFEIIHSPVTVSGAVCSSSVQTTEPTPAEDAGHESNGTASQYNLETLQTTRRLNVETKRDAVDIDHDPLYSPFGLTPLTYQFHGITTITDKTNNTEVVGLVKSCEPSEHYMDSNNVVYELLVEGRKIGLIFARIETPEYLEGQGSWTKKNPKTFFTYDGNPTDTPVGRLAITSLQIFSDKYENTEKKLLQAVIEESCKKGYGGRVCVTEEASRGKTEEYSRLGFEICQSQEEPSNRSRPNRNNMYLPEARINDYLSPPKILREVDEKKLESTTQAMANTCVPRPANITDTSPRHLRVAVIDTEDDGSVSISPHLEHCVSHGYFVKCVIRSFAPDAEIEHFRIRPLSLSENQPLIDALKNIVERIQNGEKFDAVNLSFGGAADLDKVCEDGDGETLNDLNRSNLHLYREELRSIFEKSYSRESLFAVFDKLAEHNVPVFVAAGNGGPYRLNHYLLLKGVRGIGALDLNGQKAIYSCDNNLVAEWAQGDYPVKAVIKDGDLKGYSIFGDDTVDIPIKDVSQKDVSSTAPKSSSDNSTKLVSGTSFAAPRALVRSLLEIQG